MEKITLYVGLNDKDKKYQIIDTLEATKIVKNLICSMIGGGTIYNAVGVYTHESGEIVTENTLRIELYDAEKNAVTTLIDTLKKVLNQESIIKQSETVTSEYC